MEHLDQIRAAPPNERRQEDLRPSSAARRAAGPALRVAYLLSQYPVVSQPFFLHEVVGLRARGIHIETAAIKGADRPTAELPEAEAAEAAATHYIRPKFSLAVATAVLATMFAYPVALLRGLRTLFAVRGLTLRQRATWLSYLGQAMLIGRWMKERRLTHLHVHFGGAVASVGMLTAASWRIPFSLTIHGPEELLNADAYHLREKIAHASFVCCISDFCRSQLYQLTAPSEWGKFHVIRLGVDPLLLTPHSRSPTVTGFSARPLELVCTGRLVPAKGHRILLEAVRLLRDRDVDLRVTLIGGGPERAGLEAFVERHGLGARVTFTSALSHEQTLSYLRRADMFALASFAEGIPVALMEAMSLSLPCVATSVAGIPELIRGGVDGLLVPPANHRALAEALESLVKDAALRRGLGLSARQRIISQYNLPLNQELLAHTFEMLLRQEVKEPARTSAARVPVF